MNMNSSIVIAQLESIFQYCPTLLGVYCNCIVTREGVCDEILPEPVGFPEGSGNISSYTQTQVKIQSFSITSTSQYVLVLTP